MTDVAGEPAAVAASASDGIPGADVCWDATVYDAEGRRFGADEARVTVLLAEWAKRESASLTVGLDASDEDLDPLARSRYTEARRVRLREKFLPEADALMQAARRLEVLVEAQARHHDVNTYLMRYSLRAGAMQARVDGAADVEVVALAQEAERAQSLELAGAVAATLARRDNMKPELKRAAGEALGNVAIPEREQITARAKALRDRALQAGPEATPRPHTASCTTGGPQCRRNREVGRCADE